MRRTHLLCFAAVALLLYPATAGAGTVTPASFAAAVDVGGSVLEEKTVTRDPAAAGIYDIFFVADNTFSMNDVIGNVKTVAGSLLSELNSALGDVQFGVGRYYGDPGEGVAPPVAYQLQQSITGSTAAAQAAINGWNAIGGGDTPEANFFALHQIATEGALTPTTGISSGWDTDWRAGSQKVIVWFGDAPGHPTIPGFGVPPYAVSLAEVLATLDAENVIVVALNSLGPNLGIDDYENLPDPGDPGQASQIVDATGGALVNNFGIVPVGNIVDTILAAIGAATGEIDLVFGYTGLEGVTVEFGYTDPDGYDAVGPGESRDFTVTFTGVDEGVWTGTVFVTGVGSQDVTITVGEEVIPEPSTIALLGLGLLGLGIGARRRLKK